MKLNINGLIAKKVVYLLAEMDSHVSQAAVKEVLKPVLIDYLGIATINQHKLPQKWFEQQLMEIDNLTKELGEYLD